jgi:hypothetical protein
MCNHNSNSMHVGVYLVILQATLIGSCWILMMCCLEVQVRPGRGVFVAGVLAGVGRGFLRQVGSVCAVSYCDADAAVPCPDACLNAALAPPGTYEQHL